METFITFIYGILTCVIIGGIVFGIYQIRELNESNDDLESELDDLRANHNILQRDIESKIDIISDKLIAVDNKIDTVYTRASEEIADRFEEMEDDLNELQVKE